LPLHFRSWIFIEVVKSDFMASGEDMTEDLLAQQIYQIGSRGSGRSAAPFWQWQVVFGALQAVSQDGGEQQKAVSSDLKLGLPINGLRVARLRLSDPDNAFFVVVVDLDLPTVDVSLDKSFNVQARIGADEEGWFAIQELGALAQAIPNGFDDDKKQWFIMPSFAPEDWAEDYDLEVTNLSHGKTWNLLKRDRIIAEDFLWSGRFDSVFARSAVGFCLNIQREAKIGILANAPDKRSTRGKGFKQDLVSVAAVDANEKVRSV
jgi:hypothetical protein